jgi:hypothetical protein
MYCTRCVACARPTGVVMVAPPEIPRNAQPGQVKAAQTRGDISKRARPLPNLTPSPLNVVNVHRSVFKAYPLVRAAMCLDKSLEGHGEERFRKFPAQEPVW